MKTDETNPYDWFLLAEERLRAADAVRIACGPVGSAVELLQESVERYLKGFLIGKGWSLQRIHNLSTLLDAATQRDSRFTAFADLCETLTTQFWAQHYPGGDLTDVGVDFDALRQQVDGLTKTILEAFPPPSTDSVSHLRGKEEVRRKKEERSWTPISHLPSPISAPSDEKPILKSSAPSPGKVRSKK